MINRLARLIEAMIDYDSGDPRRIHHFLKVHDFAAAIASLEGLDTDTAYILEAAAIVHDIGIHNSERKYGDSGGKHQEIEGPPEAEKMLKEVGGFTDFQTNRVCWLVGHHHTYSPVLGIDHQILLEADFLVNVYEDGMSPEAACRFRDNVFKTKTGIRLLEAMLGLTATDCQAD